MTRLKCHGTSGMRSITILSCNLHAREYFLNNYSLYLMDELLCTYVYYKRM